MALIKIKDWKSPNIDIYALTTRKDIQPNAVSLEWLAPRDAEQIGTTLNENLWNELQEGIAQPILNATYSNNTYIARLKGLNEPLEKDYIALFNGLEIKFKIPHTNTKNSPLLLLNGHNIPLKKFDSDGNIIEIIKNELSSNHIYNFIYHIQENVFICRELSLLNTQAIDSIFARLNKKIDDIIAEIRASKTNLTDEIVTLTERLSNAINSTYIDEEHYKKENIDRLLKQKEDKTNATEQRNLKANKNGDNITEKNTFRENIEVYSKTETERKIVELSPPAPIGTRFIKGIVNLQQMYDIVDEIVVEATENTKGKMNFLNVRQIVREETPNIGTPTFPNIIKKEEENKLNTVATNTFFESIKAFFNTEKIHILPTFESIKKGDIIYNENENRFYKAKKELVNGIQELTTENTTKIYIGTNEFNVDELKKKTYQWLGGKREYLATNNIEYPYCTITPPFNYNEIIREEHYSNSTTRDFNYNLVNDYIGVGYFDSGTIEFNEEGIYLVELIYIPIKINDRYSYHCPYTYGGFYNINFVANNNQQYIEPLYGNYFKNTATNILNGVQSTPYVGSDLLLNGIAGSLCLFEYKDGNLIRLTETEEATNIPLNIYLKCDKTFELIKDIKFNMCKLESKSNAIFNIYGSIGKLASKEDIFRIENNKMVLAFHKYCRWYNGNFGYNDWLYIRLLCSSVYKIK